MSGDVQPRKRKDKKKKKEELGVEEPLRGTSAIFGEGDVFMHSQHDHGTGGHWCAKVVFFSLLAILLTLIGLIILENRGLSELEANQVQTQYSGVLEGWLEDAPDDDHHDIHTLELKHHEEEHDVPPDSEEHDEGFEEDDEDEEHNDEDDDGSQEDEVDEDEQNSLEEDEDDNQAYDNENEADDKQDDNDKLRQEDDSNEEDDLEISNEDNDDLEYQNRNDDEQENKENEFESEETDDDLKQNYEEENSNENEDEEGEDDHEEDEDDEEMEVEKIEAEASDEEPIKVDLPALPEEDDDDQDDNSKDDEDEIDNDDDGDDDDDDDDDDFFDNDNPDVVQPITAPAGKPFVEVDEDDSTEETPVDTLAEEEAYEKRQEELRQEQEMSSHMWLKLGVGAALLVATHAVVRRATGPRDRGDETEEQEEVTVEETPVIDRRMTLIPEQAPAAPPKAEPEEHLKPIIQQEIAKNLPFIIKSAPTPKQVSLEEEVTPEDQEDIENIEANSIEEELYSDEEVEEEEVEVIEEKTELPKQVVPVVTKPTIELEKEESEPEDDVEIIEDEQIEEEVIDEEDEEEISDVDDAELLSRLEAKYGRLPEPERFGQKPKDGGNSVEDWPGEPSDAFWREQLDKAEEEMRQGALDEAVKRASSPQLASSCRANLLQAKCLDIMAEERKDNRLLNKAIAAYMEVLKMADGLTDVRLLDITNRTLDRIQFRGTYMSAEPIHKLLIRRFPDNPGYRNNLTITYLMANRVDLAEQVLKETLSRWPNDRLAQAHYGFVLKTKHKRYEEAASYLERALDGDTGPAAQDRFYYHLGDAYLLLGKFAEAHEVHKRGARHGHFLSPEQRSLYNVDRLKGRPWWSVDQTPYSKLVAALEKSWRAILEEGEALKAAYEDEVEGLLARGRWGQLDLFTRGREEPGRCKLAPVTCSIVKSEPAAVGCKRGQIKFSLMEPGTHVRAHVGPTNCRLRMHLGLKNTEGTFLRVHKETRQWQVGKVLIFDDSFEHEVWHNGTGSRLVLIVDVWHPQLTPNERRILPPI